MEEKERYSWYNHSAEEIYDNKENIVFVGTITVLNQQNRRIWELIEENQQLKQPQKQLAIEVLKKMKDDLLDISSPYWQYFAKSGNAFMTYEDIEQWTKEFIDNQIKSLKGEE